MTKKIGIYRDERNKSKPWTVRWYGEYDPTTEKLHRYSKAFRLKVEAEDFQATKKQEIGQGASRDKPEAITLQNYCKDWLKTKRPELRPETVNLYENAIRRLLDYFGGNTLIRQITAHRAAKFFAELKRFDHKAGKLSDWSRHRTLRNCSTMFETAIVWGFIPQNPFKSVTRPKLINQQWYYLEPIEYRRLLVFAPIRQKALYALAYTAGLRLGELLSLRWDQIDFEAGEVRIRNHKATATLPPFNIKDSEAREIPLPEHTLNILDDLKTYNEATDQTPYVLLAEEHYKTVLAKWQRYQKLNRPWRNRDMQNNTLTNFKRYIKKAGVKPTATLSIHTLRKCCITNWANTINNPEAVRKYAGHSDLKTTMRFYSKVTKGQKEQTAQAINSLVTDVKLTYEGGQS